MNQLCVNVLKGLVLLYAVSFTVVLALADEFTAQNLRARHSAFLATIGSEKVGFTSVGTDEDGKPRFIGGVRALVERNTMRYYLAINSFLAAVTEPQSAQLDTRLQSWFSAVEQYPQLHELDRSQYLTMKHDEHLRQQTVN